MGEYQDMAAEIGALVEEKNKAYGSAFDRAGEILRVLFPHGIRPDQYEDALGIVRVIDKMFRIATNKEAFGESPWRDIAGYGLLGAVKDNPNRQLSENTDEESASVYVPLATSQVTINLPSDLSEPAVKQGVPF